MQKVGVGNHNPVKTSNKQARGNSSYFCKVYVTAEPKKLTDRGGKILLRKHVNLKNRQKIHLFSFVFTCKNLIHAIFLKFHSHFATVGEITYQNIKAEIQKIFGDPAASEGSGGAPVVKSEPVFETKHEDVYQSTSSCGHGRGRQHRGRSQVRFRTEETINRQSNPIGKDGKVLRCL